MNAPTAALVAPRPERLRLVGQRRQILSTMHQRLMLGMLVYAGVVALIVASGSSISRRSATMPAASRGQRWSRSAATSSTATASRWPGPSTRGASAPSRQGDRRQARARPAPGRADARTRRGRLSRDASVGKELLLSRAARRPALVEAVNAIGEPGLALEREPDRLYPQTSLAAHVDRLHRHRRPRRCRDGARLRRQTVERGTGERAGPAVDLEPDPAGARA
jgi:cell division protein FtsI (penicillin-binding protein 3)